MSELPCYSSVVEARTAETKSNETHPLGHIADVIEAKHAPTTTVKNIELGNMRECSCYKTCTGSQSQMLNVGDAV